MKVKRVSGYPGLYREDLGKEGTRFRIRIRRNNETTQEYFFFGAKRSEAAGRAAAIKRWKELRKSLPVITRTAFAEIERRKSRTGIVGVTRVTQLVKGHEYDFWRASWTDRRGKRRTRVFSVNKYGGKEAKKLAVKIRRKGLAERGDAS